MDTKIRDHWQNVYASRQPEEVSWTQEVPQTSIDFIRSYQLPKTARIIDIGGGDSRLVDYLVKEGFENVTVLDISSLALERAKVRLGIDAARVNWIVCDITQFEPPVKYDVWHDRATFHFLTTPAQISEYLSRARKAVTGYITIGTFSESGPDKCSGLVIRKYSEEQLTRELSNGFEKIKCITEDHKTPFNTLQNFLFCSFRRKSA